MSPNIPSNNHPWKKMNKQISASTHSSSGRCVYAVEGNGCVWKFKSKTARDEWVKREDGSKSLTAKEAKAMEYEILDFDLETERVLIDRAKQRMWKEKRENQ